MKLRRDPLCELCLERGHLTAAELVHHKQERSTSPQEALELGNLQSLCQSCHSRLHGQAGPPEG